MIADGMGEEREEAHAPQVQTTSSQSALLRVFEGSQYGVKLLITWETCVDFCTHPLHASPARMKQLVSLLF